MDATDAIQAILDSGKDVVLPEGTFYVRTTYEPRGMSPDKIGLQITPQRGIRGQDTAAAHGPDGHAVFERRSTLRAIPGVDNSPEAPAAPLTLGTMIVQQGDPRPEVFIQNGAFLKWLTVHGALDGIDLRALTDQPPPLPPRRRTRLR